MSREIEKCLRLIVLIFAVMMLGIFSTAGRSCADEIVDSIKEALEYYDGGDYAEAVSSLDYAAQLIRQKRGNKLEAFLPEPLSGWKAKDVESRAAGQAMFGGMVSAKRHYSKGSSTVTVEITSDSPILQSMVMMFSNPSYATADGGKLKKIRRQKAIIKYRASKQEGEIIIIVDKRYLVSVNGTKVSEEDLINYASAIDYKKLKKF